MALLCPVGFDAQQLRADVSEMYARVADDPDGDFHFHRGPQYAAEFLGYDAESLAKLPAESTRSFAGVGNPHALGTMEPGQTVVDIGCGAGMDLLLAAAAVGPSGKAIGVDMTDAMLDRSRSSAEAAGLSNVDLRKGDAESLPVDDSTVDVVISNGVLNLTTDKMKAFKEIVRVLRPGGRLLLADIVVESELSEGIRNDIDLWASWIGGALPEAELVESLREAGLQDVKMVQNFDCFEGTSKESTARKFGVRGVNVYGRKPWDCCSWAPQYRER